uniref:NADH-ubiquinone oxidoreductase chain 6 n=1 Tax=Vannella simplex TaxID=197532 RepID=A0A2I6SRY3_9EUKA|nr:NADH dehydrogenase subunit 6 [Vannella simplex]
MTSLIFYNYFNELYYSILCLIGLLMIIMGLLIVYTKSSVHSILYLMIIFLYMTEITLILKMEFLALIFIIIYIGAVCVLMLFHIKLIKTFMIKSETNLYENNLFVPFFLFFFFYQIIQLTNVSNILLNTTNNTLLNKNINIYFFQYLNLNSFVKWIDYIDSIHSVQIIAILLYNVYFINIIYGSFILLIAMIGSILIVLNKYDINKKKLKKQIINIS